MSSHLNVSVPRRYLHRSRPRSNGWLKQNQRRLFLTTLQRYLPHPPLSIFVEGFWLYQAPTPVLATWDICSKKRPLWLNQFLFLAIHTSQMARRFPPWLFPSRF